MCLCTYVSMYVYVSLCMPMYASTLQVRRYVSACMHVSMHAWTYAIVCLTYAHPYREEYVCVCVSPCSLRAYARVCMHVCIYACVSHIYIYMLFYSYMYTYSDTRVNIYVCFHTHRQAEILGSSRFLRHPKPGVDTVRAR